MAYKNKNSSLQFLFLSVLMGCMCSLQASFNIEIKAICRFDDFSNVREKALVLGAEYVGRDVQIDTYFKTNNGRFKLRESSISGAYLVPYVRPDSAQAKKSSYVLITVIATDVAAIKELFSKVFGVETVVEKVRDIYLYQNVRIHMDEVKGLGNFFELEAVYEQDTTEERAIQEQKVRMLMQEFGLKSDDLLEGSYCEMENNLEAKC